MFCYSWLDISFIGSEFVPYLYLTPFTINKGVNGTVLANATATADTDNVLTESNFFSLMIMFNLALVHHAKDRTSMKAYSIYQLAITLLSALPPPTSSQSLLLHVAILNNYGVWCFENHECSFTIMCFEEIMDIFDEFYSLDDDIILTLNVGVKRGIYSNLQAVLNDCCIHHL